MTQYQHPKPFPEEGQIPWPFEERPFFGSDTLAAAEFLAVPESQVEEWVKSKFSVMQIGTGQGEAVKQLGDLGLDIIGLEPGLKFPEGQQSLDGPMREAGVREKIYGLYAAELIGNDEIAPDSIDIAFANGENFHTYAIDRRDFLLSLCGIFRTLKPEPSACLIMGAQKSPDNRVYIFMMGGKNVDRFMLQDLVNMGARISYTQKSDGNVAVRIYRVNDKGDDLLPHLFKEVGLDLD